MKFKDCFSQVAKGYASYRPHYPPELFAWVAGIVPGRSLAWDCACGSGQATVGLAAHFDRVVGTDASQAQLEAAPKGNAKITWQAALAHESGLPDRAVDLATVAQALHWCDLPSFYNEVSRVLRANGILAVWTYGLMRVEGELNAIIDDFYSNIVGPHWPPERKLVETGYRTLHFPFQEMAAPRFEMEDQWTLPQLLGHFRTWSATTRYIATNGTDPVEPLHARLAMRWGDPEAPRRIAWPLSIRVGRKALKMG